MANTASAQQRIRNSARKAAFNRWHRSRARTFVKNTKSLLASKDVPAAQEEVVKAISALDKAAGKGIIHGNAAARRKSRLVKQLNKAVAKKA